MLSFSMKNRKNFIVIDLEATCWEDAQFQKENSEIIEIGVSLVDFSTKSIIKSKRYLIKPKKSTVSEYCTNLTGITQDQLNKEGLDLTKASKMIRQDFNPTNIAWGGWGDDLTALKKACESQNAVFPFSSSYTDIGFLYSLSKGESKKWNLENALQNEQMNFIGKPHTGVDDAFNTARLFIKMLTGSFPKE